MSAAAFDDAEKLRRRQSLLEDDLAADRGVTSLPACVVGKVVSGSGGASTFFTLEIQTITGTEADGSAGTVTGTGINFKAVQLGSTTPTAGTLVICHRVEHRWTFRY